MADKKRRKKEQEEIPKLTVNAVLKAPRYLATYKCPHCENGIQENLVKGDNDGLRLCANAKCRKKIDITFNYVKEEGKE